MLAESSGDAPCERASCRRLQRRIDELERCLAESRQEAQRSLLESEHRYRTLVENSPVAILVHSEYKIVFINEEGVRLLKGTSGADFVGKNIMDVLHSDSLEVGRQRINSIYARKRDEKLIEERFCCLDGEVIDVEVAASRVDFRGMPASQAVIRDITARKRAEDALKESELKFRQLAENIQVIFLLRTDNRLIYISPAYDKITLHNRDKLYRNPGFLLELIYSEDRDMVEEYLNSDEVKKEGRYKIEYRIVRNDGSVCWVAARGFPITDRDGQIYRRAEILEDITERKLIEEELRKAHKLESVGILAGGIAHDFNNILTAILGNISLSMLKTDHNSEVHRLLKTAEKATIRASDLTQQLLTFSRGGEPVKQNASIEELIRESADFVLRGSNVSVRYEFSPGLLPVKVDKGQICQVIQNLTINADQAMPNGGTVEIKAKNIVLEDGESTLLSAGKYARITITDHGKGIEKKNLQKIFDPYFTTKKHGSGLGLAVVYSILRKHNGYISIESEPGEGACFTIYLPSVERVPLPKSHPRKIAFGSQKCKGYILIMDDDPVVRETGQRMLQQLGYDVETAEDGAEAVAIYREKKEQNHPFDIVIMDLTIPGGMGGKWAVRELLDYDPAAKAIVSSGYSNDPVMAQYREHGFVGVMAKPIVMDELDELLAIIINGEPN